MATLKHVDPAKAEAWKKHFEDWKKSGQRVSAFCRQRGLKIHRFYDWRTRLGLATPPTPAPTAAPAVPFVSVKVAQGPLFASVEFTLPGGLAIRLEGEVSNRRIVELARELQVAAC